MAMREYGGSGSSPTMMVMRSCGGVLADRLGGDHAGRAGAKNQVVGHGGGTSWRVSKKEAAAKEPLGSGAGQSAGLQAQTLAGLPAFGLALGCPSHGRRSTCGIISASMLTLPLAGPVLTGFVRAGAWAGCRPWR